MTGGLALTARGPDESMVYLSVEKSGYHIALF
jgi:hypothetical protein